MKECITEQEIFKILRNNPKDKWRGLIEKYVDQEATDEYIKYNNGKKSATIFNGDEMVYFTFEEAEMGTFPFEVGDIVTHILYPGSKFIIYDYPLLDDRYVCLNNKSDEENKDQRIINIMYYDANYAIDGILESGQEAGLYRSKPAMFMTEDDCHWSYLSKIGNVKDLSEDDPLYKIYLQCLEWYPHFVYHIKNKDRD